MTRKLQFLFTALLLMVGVTSAWADNTVTVTCGENNKSFETLSAAFSDDIITEAAADVTIEVSADQTLTGAFQWNKGYNLTITPTTDITIKGPSDKRWFLAKKDSGTESNLNIGSDSHSITFDGENNTRTVEVAARSKLTNLTFTNVTFKNFKLNKAKNLIEGENQDAYIELKNVTLKNCQNPSHAFIRNQRMKNDKLRLHGYLNIDSDCKGAGIYLTTETSNGDGSGTTGRLKIYGSFSVSNQIEIVVHESKSNMPKTDQVIISSSDAKNDLTTMFSLTSDNLSPIGMYWNNNYDMKLTQEYNLKLDVAGAATLVLPFESTIPDGVTCYALSYTSGDDITATTVTGGTLAANTPVLIIGTANTPYSFKTTTALGSQIVTIPGSEQTSGVLKGVYTETTPANTNYILSYKGEALAFRKADGSTNKVQPYHAYMSVTYSDPSSSAPAFYNINFGGITGISNPKGEQNMLDDENAPIYNLQGVCMNSQNLPKGIYVKNGKKFVVK